MRSARTTAIAALELYPADIFGGPAPQFILPSGLLLAGRLEPFRYRHLELNCCLWV